jgi:ribosome-associated protein
VSAGDDGVRVRRGLVIPESELRWSFDTAGGPGGQHANTANTRAELRFDIAGSPSLGPRQRARLLERLGPEVRVVASGRRSQARNRSEARERLASRLAAALTVERARVPTRATRAAKERRLDAKRRQSQRKARRSRASYDD